MVDIVKHYYLKLNRDSMFRLFDLELDFHTIDKNDPYWKDYLSIPNNFVVKLRSIKDVYYLVQNDFVIEEDNFDKDNNTLILKLI